jgi:hypothetical protein
VEGSEEDVLIRCNGALPAADHVLMVFMTGTIVGFLFVSKDLKVLKELIADGSESVDGLGGLASLQQPGVDTC